MFQSTSCNSSPSMSRIPINEVHFVSEQACHACLSLVGDGGSPSRTVKEFLPQRGVSLPRLSSKLCTKRARERERGREGERAWRGKNSNQRGRISCPNMSRIPINEATRCTSSPQRVKNSNQRGVLRLQATLRKASERERESEGERER